MILLIHQVTAYSLLVRCFIGTACANMTGNKAFQQSKLFAIKYARFIALISSLNTSTSSAPRSILGIRLGLFPTLRILSYLMLKAKLCFHKSCFGLLNHSRWSLLSNPTAFHNFDSPTLFVQASDCHSY
jgi:hypothetical protein